MPYNKQINNSTEQHEMKPNLQPVDRGTGRPSETNDCTVRALANAANMPYDVAHALLKVNGRTDRGGCNNAVSHPAYTKAGLILKAVHGTTIRARGLARRTGVPPSQGITLGTLLPSLPQGRYVVMVTGHALAVVNGQIIDTASNRAGKEVYAVYRVA